MTRMLTPDKACIGIDVPGGGSYSLKGGKSRGAFEVDSARDARLLRQAGCFPAALTASVSRRGGCRACGSRVFNRIEGRRLCASCGEES